MRRKPLSGQCSDPQARIRSGKMHARRMRQETTRIHTHAGQAGARGHGVCNSAAVRKPPRAVRHAERAGGRARVFAARPVVGGLIALSRFRRRMRLENLISFPSFRTVPEFRDLPGIAACVTGGPGVKSRRQDARGCDNGCLRSPLPNWSGRCRVCPFSGPNSILARCWLTLRQDVSKPKRRHDKCSW